MILPVLAPVKGWSQFELYPYLREQKTVFQCVSRAKTSSFEAITSQISRTESGAWATHTREEMTNSLKASNDSVLRTLTGISETQKRELETLTVQLIKLTESNEQRLDMLRAAVEKKLMDLQEDNTKQLDLMRTTVDEKLQSTLERRLGESFKQVSEQLEQVYKGLGEMHP